MNKLILSGLVLSSVAFTSAATAAEFKPASVRALGMGGSNVASTSGVDATYWNPAAYGFFDEDDAGAEMKAVDNNGMSDKAYGLDVGVTAGGYLFGPIADNLNVLQNLTIPGGNATAGLTAVEIVDTANFVNAFTGLDPKFGGINFEADAVVGARVFNYGLGVRTSIDANVGVCFDNNNVGFGTPADFINAFTNGAGVTAPGIGIPVSTAGLYFTAFELNAMRTQLENAGYTADEAASVVLGYDLALSTAGTSAAQSSQMQTALITLATAPGDLQNNITTLNTLGVALTEVGFTYGYAIDESLSVGGVIKYMQADMIVSSVNAFGSTGATTLSRDSVETVSGLGLDFGVMYRIPSWQFGLTVRNLNSPSFEHSSGYVYELKPQAKVGAAWIPIDTLTVELGYDLTKNEGAVPSSKSQYWNVGFEWDAFNILALRAGAFENTAQSDIGLVGTLGLGINLWAARLDIGAAMSTKTVVIEGSDTPTYLMASAALAVDF